MGHSRNTDNVMYERIDTQFVVDQEISDVIAGGWYLNHPGLWLGDLLLFL